MATLILPCTAFKTWTEPGRPRVRRNDLSVLIVHAHSLEAVIYSDMNDLVCPLVMLIQTRMSGHFNVLNVLPRLAASTPFFDTSGRSMAPPLPLQQIIQIITAR